MIRLRIVLANLVILGITAAFTGEAELGKTMKSKVLGRIGVALTLMIASCGQQELKFDKERWREKDDIYYKYREKMTNDLMSNFLKDGMRREEVVELLGNSEFEQGHPGNPLAYPINSFAYEISVDYGWDIDPQQGKTLYIEFAKDSTVKGFRVDEWKH